MPVRPASEVPAPQQDTPLERLRRRELERLRSWFPPGAAVLELGGRTGFHAAILESWGCSVTTVDLASPPPPATYHPVMPYDGRHLPFADRSFHVVFSSHMLYHVLGDAELFAEMRRVLAPGGSTVHLLPSPAWRVLATLGHYPYILRKVARPAARRAEPAGGSERSASTPRAHPDLRWFLERARMALVPPPLGPSRHFAAELWQWRRRGLVRLLRSHGFETTAVIPSRLFYTPYEFLGASLALRAREALSSALGSSSVAYVARPRNALDPPAARAAASRPA